MRAHTNTGFTLIEVMIVVAISSALATMIVIGHGAFMERARFNDAMDTVLSQLNRSRREVYAVVNENTGRDCSGSLNSDTGANTDCVLFGKAVQFHPDSSQITIRTLVATLDGTNFTNQEMAGLREITQMQRTSQLEWGVEFTGDGMSADTIVFGRNFTNGELDTYILPEGRVTNWNEYTEDARSEADFEFINPAGETGIIHVNESPNSLRRSFD